MRRFQSGHMCILKRYTTEFLQNNKKLAWKLLWKLLFVCPQTLLVWGQKSATESHSVKLSFAAEHLILHWKYMFLKKDKKTRVLAVIAQYFQWCSTVGCCIYQTKFHHGTKVHNTHLSTPSHHKVWHFTPMQTEHGANNLARIFAQRGQAQPEREGIVATKNLLLYPQGQQQKKKGWSHLWPKCKYIHVHASVFLLWRWKRLTPILRPKAVCSDQERITQSEKHLEKEE